MTDQTPTDDAVRRAHEWCDLHWPTDENRTPMADVIRHYRATVPAPPATLADELRDWAGSTPEEGAHWDEWDDFSGLADRAEAVEKENERLITEAGYAREAYAGQGEALKLSHQEHVEALREVARLSKEREGQEKALHEHGRLLSEARAERDEFQNEMISSERKQAKLEAEVERLTAQVARQKQLIELHGVPRDTVILPDAESTPTLPDPADVPPGEPWLVEFNGERRIALRSDPDDCKAWYLPSRDLNREGASWVRDIELALVARLVPEVTA